MQLKLPIRTLLSPRKMWSLLQAWKAMRELKGTYAKAMPNYGDLNLAYALPEIKSLSGDLTPENREALQKLLIGLLGGLDVEEEGQEQEE